MFSAMALEENCAWEILHVNRCFLFLFFLLLSHFTELSYLSRIKLSISGEKNLINLLICSVLKSGEVPPMRWIVNFDQDLLDSLVLAAQLAAYCPYLVRTFLDIVQFLYSLLIKALFSVRTVALCGF